MSIAVESVHTQAIGAQLRVRTSAELASPGGLTSLRTMLLEHIVVRVTADELIDPAAISAIATELGDPASHTIAGARAVPGHDVVGLPLRRHRLATSTSCSRVTSSSGTTSPRSTTTRRSRATRTGSCGS